MAALLQPLTLNAVQNPPPASVSGLRLRCPQCNGPLEGPDLNLLSINCRRCDFVLTKREGIWRALAPYRAEKYQRFIQEYETVRLREGRGSGGGHYYLALPFKDTSGCNSWQWRIRARTFRFVTQKILPVLEYRNPGGLDILDLGAGNGWLSYRLSLRGHRPVAVDLQVNHFDGLGAARHYLPFLRRKFQRFQAEMDRLPFASRQFDLAIFNASFHYSQDYDRTLEECLRCLRRPGHILILDSPFYFHEESGERMVHERKAAFERKYGFKSDSISSREFLTRSIVSALAQRHGIGWDQLTPWYGLGWSLRPLRARLLKRREPAKFYVFWGSVE